MYRDLNGETGRRLVEQIDEREGKDKNSHVFQHSVKSNHAISKALFIKSNIPNLNKQDTTVTLKLFN